MTRDRLGVVTGLAVFVIGAIAVFDLIGAADERPVENLAPSITEVAVSGAAVTESAEELPGVGSAVIRVLHWSGNVDIANDGDLAHLPPSVAAILIEYGTPLLVPTASAQAQ